nr:PilX N-terminal domain-containing pilus assembly protein [Dyella lutea]
MMHARLMSRPKAVLRRQRPARRHERGVALVVALLLLVVIALVGLAAMRGTIMQQKMAANQYDRQVAFQSAEAALRAAQQRIQNNPGDVARDCRAGGVACTANPFDDSGVKIITVEAGTGAGQFTKSGQSLAQPQYIIEDMGSWYDPSSDTGFNQTANAAQFGVQGLSSTAEYYRITARSGDPSQTGSRAVVTLQAIVKQD